MDDGNVTEDGWSDSNGGFSSAFQRPCYQNGKHNSDKRGLPDLSAYAHPGYEICQSDTCTTVGGKFYNTLNPCFLAHASERVQWARFESGPCQLRL